MSGPDPSVDLPDDGVEGIDPDLATTDGRERSPRRGMCAAALSLEAIVLGLAAPVMIRVSHVDHVTALWTCLGLAVACVVVAGLLRREWAYGLGWALQLAAILLGLAVTTMYFLGAVFALLWASSDLLGRKIDRERAAAYAAFDAENRSSTDPG